MIRPVRVPTVVAVLLVVVALAVGFAASAHHSAAAFDATQTISIEGAVTRYEWKNPHVYIWLAAPNADGSLVEWELEGQPPGVLRRLGWSQDTLSAGDALQVTGNPARNEQRKRLLVASMKRAETTLYDSPTMMSALTAPGAVPEVGAEGLAGVWVGLLDMDAMRGYLNPGRRVPLTEAGTAAQAAYDEATMSPALRCIPTPAPAFMFAPDVKRVTLEDGGVIRIAGEFAAAERVIHVTPDAAGASAQGGPVTPSVHGHAVGRWDGTTLVVETTHFAPHGAGIGFTLPSSAQKRLVERLTLDADGKGLAYTFELTDPDVLTAPVTGGSRWVYRPDLEYAPVPCDLENARRFTE
jgi:hypothetical protein